MTVSTLTPTKTAAPMPATTGRTTIPTIRTTATPEPTTSTVPPKAPATSATCPSSLPSRLATTGGSTQLITAETNDLSTSYATVTAWQKRGDCWVIEGGPWSGRIGENGFSEHHREGDGTTPVGLYSFAPVVYGTDPDPGTVLPYHELQCGDWWDEDPTSGTYNTFQHVACGTRPTFAGGSEALWTETDVYQSFIPIDYNTDPVIAYAGSAIFLHVDDGQATTGCVAIPLVDLDQVLRWIRSTDSPRIAMGPQSLFAGL